MFASGALQTYAPVHKITHCARSRGPEHACMACMRSMQALTILTGQVRKGLHVRGAGDPAPVQVQLGARAARLQLRQRPGQAGEHPQDQRAVKDRDRQHLRAQGEVRPRDVQDRVRQGP